MQPSSVAYHFDPALRSLKESQNNSFRTSFPFAMKRTVELSHFSSFCLIPNLFFPPCCCSIQTDKNAEAAFGEGIGDWRSGIIWAFCQTFLKGHGTFLTWSFQTGAFLPARLWDVCFGTRYRNGKDVQPYGANLGALSRCALLQPSDVTRADRRWSENSKPL